MLFDSLLHLRRFFLVLGMASEFLMADDRLRDQRQRQERLVELMEEVEDLDSMERRLQAELDNMSDSLHSPITWV